uniref:Uncharacterized protein n=1 Tax=Tetraodon nigroviridis TaxID=99883 RepID=H3D3Y1_TETNG
MPDWNLIFTVLNTESKAPAIIASAEIVVCASYYPSQPRSSFCGTGQMTVSPEVLRQYGLSLLHSHIVLLTRTRACPLEPPTPSLPAPRWKLNRMPKKLMITD